MFFKYLKIQKNISLKKSVKKIKKTLDFSPKSAIITMLLMTGNNNAEWCNWQHSRL